MDIQNLTKTIDDQLVLDHLSTKFYQGEITGILGRNGVGKTTLFRIIANHYQEDAGNIFINQQELHQHPKLQQKIFYIDEQYNFLSAYSLEKIVTFYQTIYPDFDQENYERLIKKISCCLFLNLKRCLKVCKGCIKSF